MHSIDYPEKFGTIALPFQKYFLLDLIQIIIWAKLWAAIALYAYFNGQIESKYCEILLNSL